MLSKIHNGRHIPENIFMRKRLFTKWFVFSVELETFAIEILKSRIDNDKKHISNIFLWVRNLSSQNICKLLWNIKPLKY